MADMTLCASPTCPARQDCRRNAECPTRIPPGAQQWYAAWNPEAAHSCPEFIDGRKWRERPEQ